MNNNLVSSFSLYEALKPFQSIEVESIRLINKEKSIKNYIKETHLQSDNLFKECLGNLHSVRKKKMDINFINTVRAVALPIFLTVSLVSLSVVAFTAILLVLSTIPPLIALVVMVVAAAAMPGSLLAGIPLGWLAGNARKLYDQIRHILEDRKILNELKQHGIQVDMGVEFVQKIKLTFEDLRNLYEKNPSNVTSYLDKMIESLLYIDKYREQMSEKRLEEFDRIKAYFAAFHAYRISHLHSEQHFNLLGDKTIQKLLNFKDAELLSSAQAEILSVRISSSFQDNSFEVCGDLVFELLRKQAGFYTKPQE